MAKYKIGIARVSTAYVEVEVEAQNEYEAHDKAQVMAGDIDFSGMSTVSEYETILIGVVS